MLLEIKDFPQQAGEATYHAMNRTADFIVSESTRQVTKVYAVKSSEVRASLKAIKPTRSNLNLGVLSKGHTLSLSHFPHTPTKPGKRSMVKASIFKGSKKSIGKHAFIAPTGAKSEDKVQNNVFKRTGIKSVATKGRYEGLKREEVTVIRTLSIPQMLGNEEVAKRVQMASGAKLAERLEHELIREITKAQSRIRG